MSDAQRVGFIPQGGSVAIYCTTRGDIVQNYVSGDASNVWYYVGDGYLPEVLVNTATAAPTMGSCR